MYKKLAIQTIIYSIGIILPKMINYYFIRFFTFSLERNEFSIYTDMYSISFLIIGFLSFGLENTYFRFLYKKNNSKDYVFSNVTIIQLLIVFLSIILYSNFRKELIYIIGYSQHPEYLTMFFLIIWFDTICALPMAWIRINDKPILYATINITVMMIQSFLIFYMFFCFKNYSFIRNQNYLIIFNLVNSFTNKIGYIFFSNMISSFFNLVLVIPIFIKRCNFLNFNINLAKKMISYSIPIMLGTIAFSINENLDKILIKRWLSDDINGSYSACYKIASFMSLYIRVFRLGIEPFFFKKSKDSNAKYYYEETIYLFILFGLIFYVLICGNIPIFINLLINKKYHSTISIIPIILMGNLFLGIYTNLSIFYKIVDKPFVGTYISFIGVLMTLIFNIIFIIYPHFIIPAWGTFISYGSMLLFLFFWSKRNFLNFCKNIKSILFHFFIAIFIVFIMYKIQSIKMDLIIQIIYLIIIFFYERKKIISLFT